MIFKFQLKIYEKCISAYTLISIFLGYRLLWYIPFICVKNSLLYIFFIFQYALEHYIKLLTFNDFTAVVFGEIIIDIFNLTIKFDYIDLLIYIVTYTIEILGVLVFIEAIELNFCNLDVNLKKNIILRAGNEIDSLYNYQNESENESEEPEENLLEDLNDNQSNNVYK